MSFETSQRIARETLAACRGLGFDQLTVTATWQQELGVRIAQSVVCRENVLRESTRFNVLGIWQGRSSGFERGAASADELTRATLALRRDIEGQSVDKELVVPVPPPGSYVWEATRHGLLDLYAPETVYKLLDKHVARVRDSGWRVTGYLEASETISHSFTLTGTDVKTRDTGMTLHVTVDDGEARTTGATQRSATHATPEELDRLIADAVDEALRLAETSRDPHEVEPGDYTVVLHPGAALDIIQTALFYGLFDRRRIEEKRTFLSGKLEELTFPEGLRLSQSLSIPMPNGGSYADAPFNGRLMPCESLTLITQGRVRDLHVTPFWAQKLGIRETFSAQGAPALHLEAEPGTALRGRHKTIHDLIAGTKQGLYVANTWYLRMVAEMEGVITGMTRDGLYEINDGKLTRPVKHMRWHDNPFRILANISGLSDDAMLLGRSRLAGRGRMPLALMPAMRVEGFHFSSVTKF